MLHQQQQQPLQQQQQFYASQPTQAVLGRPHGNANGTGKQAGFTSRATMVFGIFQIIFGVICVILGITAIVIDCRYHESGIGIWCGVMFAVAGSFGIAAYLRRTKATIITTMVLAIISATMAPGPFFVGIYTALTEDQCQKWKVSWYPYFCDTPYGSRVAIDIILAVVGLAELVIAILQFAFCCSAYCWNQEPSASTLYIAERSSEGASQGFRMAVIQNEPTQHMASSEDQQPAPQGYILNVQQVGTSNQQPRVQLEPQPGVVYQQGQGVAVTIATAAATPADSTVTASANAASGDTT